MQRRRTPSLAGSLPRILMIAPTPFFADRGCHVRIYEEARALQALGCQVEVCTYHLGRDRPGLTTHRTLRIPWYNKLAAGFSWHKFYIDVLLALKAWRVARRFQPDLVHGHLHEGAVIGWAVGQMLRAPVIGDFQGSLSGELKAHEVLDEHGWFYRFVAHNERWIDRLPNVAVASCSDVADELRNRFGVSDVILALDGVDTEAFRPGLETGELTSWVPEGRRAVVYLGLLNAYQGVDHLLAAMPRVLARVPEAYFLLMGYPDEEKYRQKAREMGVAEHVSFPGRIDYSQAPRYLALGEVAAGPKLSETESNGKLYNYMACGLPTVTYDTPVSREILGDLGIYAPRGDVAALGDAIAGLLENPEAARRLGQKLRQRVVERFSWQHTAKQLLQAYALAIPKKLTESGPRTTPECQEEAEGNVHPAER
jgi:glycosyltransferase involved in cell wall biosynthesis